MSKKLSPDQTARIRDALASKGDSAEKRSRFIKRESVRLDRPELSVQSVGAHVPIQRDRTLQEIQGTVRSRRRDNKVAMEKGLSLLAEKGVLGIHDLEENLNVRQEALDSALELLRCASADRDLFEVIDEFSRAGDTDALDAIAHVYEKTRPDLAVRALISAGRIERAVALVVELERQGFGARMNCVLKQFDSVAHSS